MTDDHTTLDELRDELTELKNHYGREIANDRQRIAALEDEIETLRETIELLRERIVELEYRFGTEVDEKDYDALTRSEKVGMLRQNLVSQAHSRRRTGRSPTVKATYSDVQMFFGGRPSPAHCYSLMREAAAAPGIEYQEPDGKKTRNYVRVDLDAIPDGTTGTATERPSDGVDSL